MPEKTYQDKIIWIIGASSGIGAALSRELAQRGAILVLSSRRIEDLEILKGSLPGKGHTIFSLDVCQEQEVTRVIKKVFTQWGRIDSVIFLAAAYTPMKIDSLNISQVRQIIDTNLLGVFYLLQGVIPFMKEQLQGQIALCGSVAGYIGLPGGQPYSSTKAGIINIAESLRAELPLTIDVKLISPGFVKTSLTAKNNFQMPFIIDPKMAAKFIADGLLKSKFEIHFPKKFTFFLKLLRLLPYSLSMKITSKIIS